MELTEKQKLALSNSKKKAKIHEKGLEYHIGNRFDDLGIDKSYINKIINHFTNNTTVTSKIKELVGVNQSIFQIWLDDPTIKNSFETKSKGAGYDVLRTGIENLLFHNAYSDAIPQEKPKYGSINFKDDYFGDPLCVSYGRVTLIYKPEIKDRVTFTFNDSFVGMLYICTFKYFSHILYHISERDIKAMIEIIDSGNVSAYNFTTYIEAQIHGPVDVSKDVERITIPKDLYDAHKNSVDTFQEKYPQIDIIIY